MNPTEIDILQYKKNKYKYKYLLEKNKTISQKGGICVTPNHQTDENGNCIKPSIPFPIVEGSIPIPSSFAIVDPDVMDLEGSTDVIKNMTICKQKTFFNLLEYKIKTYSIDSAVHLPGGLEIYQSITLEHIDPSRPVVHTFVTDDKSVISSGTFGSVVKFTCSDCSHLRHPVYISVKYGRIAEGIDKDIAVIDFLRDKQVTELYVPSLYIKGSPPSPHAIIMEYIDGTLNNIPVKILGDNNFIVLFNILLQIAKTLNAFKKYNTWYLDYKPENIFYRCNPDKTFQVIFGDLGSLCVNGSFCSVTHPPIVFNETGPFNDYELVWGVAIMMFTLTFPGLGLPYENNIYGWNIVEKFRTGVPYQPYHNNNIYALKRAIKVHTGNSVISACANQIIDELIDSIFAVFNIHETHALGKKIITLDKVIKTLETIIFLLNN